MTNRALVSSFLSFAAAGLSPEICVADPCDPVGHYQIGYSWKKGNCQALPGDELMEIDIVRGADGKYALGPQPEVTPRRLSVSPTAAGCRIVLEQEVNQTAYGAPDPAQWSMTLDVSEVTVKGTGTYRHVEGSGKRRQCQQALSITGTKGAAAAKEVVAVKVEAKRSPEEIAQMLGKEIEPRRAAVNACWDKAHPDGKGEKGWVRLHISVRRDGTVRAADLVEDKLGDPAVAGCVIETAKTWTFTSPGADEVDYAVPFVFPPKKDAPPEPPKGAGSPPPPAAPPAK